MKLGRLLFAAAVLAIAPLSGGLAQETPATKAQKQHEELKTRQSLDRLRDTRKSLQSAIERLETSPDTPAPTAGITPQGGAMQQIEQALLDVRRAIDELNVPQDQRQTVLDKLDDADSAMRMARQPDADAERKRLRAALEEVHKEIEVAQETMPAPSSDER